MVCFYSELSEGLYFSVVHDQVDSLYVGASEPVSILAGPPPFAVTAMNQPATVMSTGELGLLVRGAVILICQWG